MPDNPNLLFDISLSNRRKEPTGIFDIDLSERRKIEENEEVKPLFDIDLTNRTPTGLPSISQEKDPGYKPRTIDFEPEQHVGGAERFGKAFAESLIPFGWYDADLPEPEGFGESLTQAIGGVAGFLPYALLAKVTGGASIPLTNIEKTSKLYRNLAKASKISKSQWVKEAKKIATDPTNRMFMIRGATGFIGGSKAYIKGLQSIAAKGPGYVKMAKAFDVAQRNFVPFAAYGQLHMKPNSPLEDRFKQLGVDTLTTGAFTAFGAPSTILWSNTTGLKKAGMIAAESAGLFGLGAWGDGGTTDIPFHERLAHGLVLSTMHGVMRGLSREGSKRQMIEELRRQGYTEEQAIRLTFETVTGDRIVDSAKSLVENDKNLFVSKDYFQKGVGRPRKQKKELGDYLIRFDPNEMIVRPKNKKPYLIYERFYAEPSKDGFVEKKWRDERIEGKSVVEVLRRFNNRFISIKEAKSEVQSREQLPGGPTKGELEIQKVHQKYASALQRASKEGVERKATVTERADYNVKGPEYLTIENELRSQIKRNNSEINNIKKRLKRNRSRVGKELAEWKKDELNSRIEMLSRKNKSIEIEIQTSAPARLSEPVKVGRPKYKGGDFVRIPLYEGNGKFSTVEAGIGKFIGKYDDVIKSERLSPKDIKTGATTKLKNADVFEVTNVKGPERVEYVTLNRPGVDLRVSHIIPGFTPSKWSPAGRRGGPASTGIAPSVQKLRPKADVSIEDLPLDAPYNKLAIQRYSDLGVKADRPFEVSLHYKKQHGSKWVPFKDIHTVDAEAAKGFATRAEAEAWANANWRGVHGQKSIREAETSQIEAVNQFSGSPKYQEWQTELKDIQNIMRSTSGNVQIQKEMVKLYFPENQVGEIKLLNLPELKELRSRFEVKRKFDMLPEDVGVTPPPSVLSEGISPTARKILTKNTGLFPIHTVIEWMGPAGKWISNKMLRSSRVYRKMMGATQAIEKEVKKLIGSRDWHNLAIHMDDKYIALRKGKDYQRWYDKNSEKNTIVELPDGSKTSINNVEYAANIMRNYFDSMFVAQSKSGYLIKDSRTNKQKPVLRVLYNSKRILDEGSKNIIVKKGTDYIPINKISSRKPRSGIEEEIRSSREERTLSAEQQILDIAQGKLKMGNVIYTREYIPKLKGERLVEYTINKVVDNAYNNNYFPRMITDNFFKTIYRNSELKDAVLLDFISSTPEIEVKLRTRKITLDEAKELAMKEIRNFDGMFKRNKVFGQMWTRVADLPTHMFFSKAENSNLIRIKTNRTTNEAGEVFKVGDTLEGKKIDKVLQVYDFDFPEIMRKYSERTARSTSAYDAFGGIEGLNKGEVNVQLDKLRKEAGGGDVGDFYRNYAKKALDAMVMGQDVSERGPVAKMISSAVSQLTRTSASIGLSAPLSGFKNILLGQVQNATHFQIRSLLKSYWDLMTGGWMGSKSFAESIGAKYTGVYDLYLSSNRASGYWDKVLKTVRFPGMMQQTEMINRIISSTMGHRMLELHLDNLAGLGKKSLIAPRRTTSRHVLMDIFKFDPKEVANMVERRRLGGRGYDKKALEKASDLSHTITQGVGDYPYVPYWMGKDFARPLTLFYRIGYRMTNNIVNNVMTPAIRDGNLFPMMKYVGLSMGAGSALYSTYYYLFDEERKNRFKDAPAGYWSNLIRAEGLGLLSNAFDEYGEGVIDVYAPVVMRNFVDVYKEAMNIAEGKKRAPEAIGDLSKRTIAAVGFSMRIADNLTKDTRKRYTDSRRRQRQFLDAYFKDWNPPLDSDDALTTRTPFYRHIRSLFWYNDEEDKARAYYSALGYLTDQIEKEGVATGLSRRRAEKKAKSILKSIISRQRPIPGSWRKRERGAKASKYNIYVSKLERDDAFEEIELDNLYKQKKRDFWRAVRQYRSNYYGK